jgi:hypothetical protein
MNIDSTNVNIKLALITLVWRLKAPTWKYKRSVQSTNMKNLFENQ